MSLLLTVLLLMPIGGEDGASAPPNCWTVPRGAVSGSGHALTRPVRGPIEVGWAEKLKHPIEGTPLVWDDYVVVTTREDKKRGAPVRRLHLFDLQSGAQKDVESIKSQIPLDPSMWGPNVVVRRSEGEDKHSIQTYSIRNWKWRGPSTRRLDSAPTPPLLYKTELYIGDGRGLTLARLGQRRPVWEKKLGPCRSRVVLRGDFVYVISAPMGPALCQVRRDGTNHLIQEFHGGDSLKSNTLFEIGVLGSELHIRHPAPLRFGADGAYSSRFTFEKRPNQSPELSLQTRFLATLPAERGKNWIEFSKSDSKPKWYFGPPEKGRIAVLASRDHHPELVAKGSEIPPTVSSNIAYMAHRAIDLDARRILWEPIGQPNGPMIPAKKTVLFVDSNNRLVALRDRLVEETQESVPTVKNLDAHRVVLQNGSVYEDGAKLRLDGSELIEMDPKRDRIKARHPVEGILMIQDAEGQIVFGSRSSILAALDILSRHRMLECLDLAAKRSKSTNDLELMQAILGEALGEGLHSNDLQKLEEKIGKLEQKPQKPKRNKAHADAQQALTDSKSVRESLLFEFVELCGEDRFELKVELLRRLLAANAKHERALARLQEMIPEHFSIPNGTKPLERLDLAWAYEKTGTSIQIIEARASTDTEATPDQRYVGATKRSWPANIRAYRSEDLMILTRPSRPGSLARCLLLGHMVCRKLEEMFALQKDAANKKPLALLLFESKAEYAKFSGGLKGHGGKTWTAGHYDPGAGQMRIFIPSGEEQFESVMETYAHELTHHWLDERAGKRRSAYHPGYWIVEGIASFVEEFRYDPVTSACDDDNPRARRLDFVANLEEGHLLPWKKLYELSHADFGDLDREQTVPVNSTWLLGRWSLSEVNRFYAQAAATCHFLYHGEEQKYRARLLQYVKDYYAGNAGDLVIQKAFGLSPEALGKKVAAYARARLAEAE